MAVTEMDKVTQNNAATAEETASASEQLSAQAEQMKGMVSQVVAMAGGDQNTGKNQRMPASHGFRKKSAGKRIMSNPAKNASVSVGNASKTGVVGPENLISMDENELSNF
jgi:methyl-accepting chemotaxis protein